MYQPSHSLHSFLIPPPQSTTPTLSSTPVSHPTFDTAYKTEPCWVHLLDDDNETATLESCSWMDILCSGQHPKETREYINDARCTHGLTPLESDVVVVSELDKEAQIELCEDAMIELGWRAPRIVLNRTDVGRGGGSGGGGGSTAASSLRIHHHVHHSNEKMYRLESEVQTLRAQLQMKMDTYRGNYSQDPNKATVELMTRNAILETEMEHYRIYMSSSVSRFKMEKKRMMRTIKSLEKELILSDV